MTIANRYNLLKQLGEGGFGEVWLAEDTMTSTQVALKLYKVNSRGHDELVREYRLVSGLKHPNLLTASYVGRDDKQGISFLEMDYCRYGSLENKRGNLTEKQIWQCIRDVSAGLQALASHTVFDEKSGKEVAAPVVHQDIKPANILIRSRKENGEMTFAIADFGISKMNISQKSGSSVFVSAGTLAYMGPERFFPDYKPIIESDIWSLGAMLYELVERKLPFPSMDTLSGGNWLNQEGVILPKIANTIYSLQLRQLIIDCLEKKTEDRPSANKIEEIAKNMLGNCPNWETPKFKSVEQITEYVESLVERGIITDDDKIFLFKIYLETSGLQNKHEAPTDSFTKSDIVAPQMPYHWNIQKKAGSRKPLIYNIHGVKFYVMPVDGGEFIMGSNGLFSSFRGEYPCHKVSVGNFGIAATLVTQNLYETVMGDNPSNNRGDNLPVENVTWYEAQEFVNKLSQMTGHGFRLPTEAEWEFAARGGILSGGYKYSGSDDVNDVAWCFRRSDFKTHPVAEKKGNELGLYDMSGNVWEWCSDWYAWDYYRTSPVNNPQGPESSGFKSGEYKVIRGGSWRGYARECAVTSRSYSYSSNRENFIGFRLALTL